MNTRLLVFKCGKVGFFVLIPVKYWQSSLPAEFSRIDGVPDVKLNVKALPMKSEIILKLCNVGDKAEISCQGS